MSTKAKVVAWGDGIKIDFGGSLLNVHTYPSNEIDPERAADLYGRYVGEVAK
jgi:hypothetical protein